MYVTTVVVSYSTSIAKDHMTSRPSSNRGQTNLVENPQDQVRISGVCDIFEASS